MFAFSCMNHVKITAVEKPTFPYFAASKQKLLLNKITGDFNCKEFIGNEKCLAPI